MGQSFPYAGSMWHDVRMLHHGIIIH